jgi:hypothetical protein
MTQEQSNIPELEDTFFLHNHPTKRYLLKLSPISLSIISKQDEHGERNRIQTIPIDEIYGCLYMKSNVDPTLCHLTFYLYELRRSHGMSGIFSKKRTLHRSERTFTYGTYDDFEQNSAEVIRWHRHVKQAIYCQRNLPRNFNEIFGFF